MPRIFVSIPDDIDARMRNWSRAYVSRQRSAYGSSSMAVVMRILILTKGGFDALGPSDCPRIAVDRADADLIESILVRPSFPRLPRECLVSRYSCNLPDGRVARALHVPYHAYVQAVNEAVRALQVALTDGFRTK